jgi:hypothetical protein
MHALGTSRRTGGSADHTRHVGLTARWIDGEVTWA